MKRLCVARADRRLQRKLPISYINPSTKLETHLFEMGNFPKAKLLMKSDARLVWKGNAAYDAVYACGTQLRKQVRV